MKRPTWISSPFRKQPKSSTNKEDENPKTPKRTLEPERVQSFYGTPLSCDFVVARTPRHIDNAEVRATGEDTQPTLRIRRFETNNATPNADLFSVSVSPLSSLEFSLSSQSGYDDDYNNQLNSQREPSKDKQSLHRPTITERLSKKRQSLKKKIKGWKRHWKRNLQKLSKKKRDENASQQKQVKRSTKKIKLGGHKAKTCFNDFVNREMEDSEELIASVIKVGGDLKDRKKKTTVTSKELFERCIMDINNPVKGGHAKNADVDAIVKWAGRLDAEKQAEVQEFQQQLQEKDSQIDLLQQQLVDARKEIETSIDFYAGSVIKLEGNIMAMSEEHEREVAILKSTPIKTEATRKVDFKSPPPELNRRPPISPNRNFVPSGRTPRCK